MKLISNYINGSNYSASKKRLSVEDPSTGEKISEVVMSSKEDFIKTIESSKTSAVVSPNKSVLKNSDDSNGVRVKSPIIGTAYLAPEPGAKKFIEVGDKVKKGQTVMIVEAMKTMNHVPSTSDGVVKKILVEDSQPVEFGQTLVILN